MRRILTEEEMVDMYMRIWQIDDREKVSRAVKKMLDTPAEA